MISGDWLGILFALTSAMVWGSGDFSGGLATRRNSQFQVLALSALSGLLLLVLFAALWGEAWPSARGFVWAGLAGAAGALGIAALYRGLSQGNAATVAPTAAVLGAVLPVVFGILLEGWPSLTRLAGFGLAIPGLGLVSMTSSPGGGPARQSFFLAVLAGVGFGGFFILIAQVEPGPVFTPLVVARSVALSIALLLLLARRTPLPALTANPIALLAGLLDAGGNIFYLLARQFTRLDVAAVLSSLYPAATVLLARLLLQETVSRPQALGALLCLLAAALIAL